MADGDEKIDENDRVWMLNRMVDQKVAIPHDGRTITWQPGQRRSIQRIKAFDHFLIKSRVHIDPTGEKPGVYALVVVNDDGQPINPDDSLDLEASTEPLTAAYCQELRKHGFLDLTNLPPDRQFGGDHSMQLVDEETGQHPNRYENRGAPKEGPIPRAPGLPASDRSLTGDALDRSGAAPD